MGRRVPEGQDRVVQEMGMEYTPASAILGGRKDEMNLYWNSFLPIFFDRMNYLLKKDLAESVKEYDLISVHASFLIALNLHEGQTLVELSDFLDMHTANTNRVIKTLKEKNFVYDDRKTPSSKKFKIYLTEEGKKVSNNIMHFVQEKMKIYFSGMTEEESDALRGLLVKILYNIDPGFEEYVDLPQTNPFYTYLSIYWPTEDPDVKYNFASKKKL